MLCGRSEVELTFLLSQMPVVAHHNARNLPLDVLRGVAILLVLFSHSVSLHEHAGWAEPVIKILQTGGWTGVDLFFVLSGFLIGGLLLKEINRAGTVDARRFLVRRAFKIWPVYFAFLAFLIARSVRHAPHAWDGIRRLLPNLIHLQNYFGGSERTPWTHTWSLAVEEHFYIALPVLLLFLCRFGKLSWFPVWACSRRWRVLQCGCRIGISPMRGCVSTRRLTCAVDSLVFGVLLAYVYHLRPSFLAFVPKARIALVAGGLALIAPSFYWGLFTPFAYTIGFTLNYLGYGCILIACVDARDDVLGRLLASPLARAVAFIGFYSYSIYLWHDLAREQIIDHLHSIERYGTFAFIWTTAADILLATALGLISAMLIERPFLWLRDRLFPSHTPAGPVAHQYLPSMTRQDLEPAMRVV